MEEPAEDSEDRLETFKEEKCKAKTNFTLARRKLSSLIDDDHPPRRNQVRNECNRVYEIDIIERKSAEKWNS